MAAILLAFIAKGILWILLLPPLQGPDETEHLAYVERMATQPSLIPAMEEIRVSEGLQAFAGATEAYSIIHAPLARGPVISPVTSSHARQLVFEIDADAGERLTDTPSRARWYPPLYYLAASAAWEAAGERSYFTRMYFTRSFSLLLATGSLALLMASLVRLSSSDVLVIGGSLIAALSPMLTFVAVLPNPDVLVMTGVSAITWLVATSITRRRLSWRSALLLGIVMGAGAYTKQTFAIVAPAVAISVLTCAWYASRRWAALVVGASIVATAAMISGGWYYLARARGVGRSDGPAEVIQQFEPLHLTWMEYLRWFWEHRAVAVRNEFWGVFGWLDAPMPVQMYEYMTWGATLVAVLAFAGALRSSINRRVNIAIVAIATIPIALIAALGIVERGVLAAGTEAAFIQGRYFVICFTPLVVLATCGIEALTQREAVRSAIIGGLCVLLGVASIVSVTQALIPRYYG